MTDEEAMMQAADKVMRNGARDEAILRTHIASGRKESVICQQCHLLVAPAAYSQHMEREHGVGTAQGTGLTPEVAGEMLKETYGQASARRFTKSEVLIIIEAEQARLEGLFPDDSNSVDTTLREGGKRLASALRLIFERLK